MKIGEFSVRNPVLVNMLVVVILVAGVLCYGLLMSRELFPQIKMEIVSVLVLYPGTSPEQMERLVAKPLEEEIKDVDGIDEVVTTCNEGRCRLLVKLEAGEDLTTRKTEIKDAVDLADLPDDAEDPVVKEVSFDFARMVITVAVAGSVEELRLVEIVDDLEDVLENVPGVATVLAMGRRDREVWVNVNPVRAEQYHVDLQMVADAIAHRNVNLPGGTVKTGTDELVVRTEADIGEKPDIQKELEDVVVKPSSRGAHVHVRDVAEVVDTFEEATTRSRVNGQPAVNLVVFKRRSGDTIRIADLVRERVEEFRHTLPEGVEISLVNDLSYWIRNRLNTVRTNGLVGLGIVLVLLFVFMNGRMAVMTAFGIPFSFAGALLFMKLAGISVNMLSLFSLIIVLGMIVDDAIIVTENIYRHMAEGEDPKTAAIRGTSEVTWPVVCTVLTTVAAFVPMLLMTGMMGKFMGIIPKVVSIALLASLIEALIVLPSHMSDFVRHRPEGRLQRFRDRLHRGLLGHYEPLLRLALRHRYSSTLIVLAIAGAAVFVGTRMPFDLFPLDEVKIIQIDVETPPQRRLEETDRVVQAVEKVALELPERESVTTRVGLWLNPRGDVTYGSNKAQVTIEIVDPGLRERSSDEIIEHLRRQVGHVRGATSVEVKKQKGGPPVGSAVEVRVRGDDFEALRQIAGEIQDFLAATPGVTDVRTNYEEGKQELRVVPTEDKARAYGLERRDIARIVRYAHEGAVATKLRVGNDEVDVLVKYPEWFRNDPSNLERLKFRSRTTGRLAIPLRSFATVERRAGHSTITRIDRKRTLSVTADVDTRIIDSKTANRLVRERFADVPRRFPGCRLDYGGQSKETQESMASLALAGVVALLLIYAILASLFKSFGQPLVVMFTVPFALIGVVTGLAVAGQPLSLLALIGTLALAGIVVNDSLVMVEFINSARRAGVPRDEAILRSGRVRMRPILLTTITTCGGLMPTALGMATGLESFLAPFAITLVWGLAFATVLTLLVIPCIYAITDDITRGLGRLLSPVGRWLFNQET